MFSVANMIIASAVSTLPLATINGVAIGNNIDGITYSCMNGFTSAVVTFVGQNYGARKQGRMWRSLLCGVIHVTVIGIAVAALELTFADQLCNLYVGSDIENRFEVIEAAKSLMYVVLPLYFLCGVMGVLAGFLRGVGNSVAPMVASVVAVFAIRITWIYCFFPMFPDSLQWLYLCQPITWICTCIVNLVMIFFENKRLKNLPPPDEVTETPTTVEA